MHLLICSSLLKYLEKKIEAFFTVKYYEANYKISGMFFNYTLDKCKENISEPEHILYLLHREMLFLVPGIVMNWIKK